MTTTKQEKMKTVNTKQTRKNMEWLMNPDQIKTPKQFNVTFERDENGNFNLMKALYIKKVNQHVEEFVPVDARDIARVMNRSTIKAR